MIRSLTIRNFLAIAVLTFTIDVSGVLIEGGNGRGKSSVLKALKAALDGAGISPEAVRKGETQAEILVDLDHETVTRRILASGKTTIEVGTGSTTRKKPAAFLSELLGVALLDPLDLLLAKPAERRDLVTRAIPCVLTMNDALAAMPETMRTAETISQILGPKMLGRHGLESAELLAQAVAEQRLDVGRRLKDRKAEAASLSASEQAHARTAQDLRAAPSKDTAQAAVRRATKAKAELDAQAATAARTAAFVASRKASAAKLQAEAARVRQDAPAEPSLEETTAALNRRTSADEHLQKLLGEEQEAEAEVRRLEELVRQAKANVDTAKSRTAVAREQQTTAHETVAKLMKAHEDRKAALAQAVNLEGRADQDLQDAEDAGAAAPTPEAIEDAARALRDAEEAAQLAEEADRARAAHASAAEALRTKAAEVEALTAQYAALDASVKALTTDVPRQLLASAGGITGLAFEGDTILVDDGKGARVALDQLSSAAQMAFCLDVAKRLNTKSKILLVDGLERLDPTNLEAFVKLATQDGYQLFATRVTEGPLAVRPIGGAS